MKLVESTKDVGNESAITTGSKRSDQGGRNECLDGASSLAKDKPENISLRLTNNNNKALPKLNAL